MSDFTKNIENDASKPELCVGCQQFFGNKATEGYCSKCYRDRATKAKTSAETQAETLISKVSEASVTKTEVIDHPKEEAKNEKAIVSEVTETKEEQTVEKQDPTRCLTCTKKVGLLGFKCKCESVFCRTHRQPESHNCTFDFAKAGRDRLAKENVVVKADKIERF